MAIAQIVPLIMDTDTEDGIMDITTYEDVNVAEIKEMVGYSADV